MFQGQTSIKHVAINEEDVQSLQVLEIQFLIEALNDKLRGVSRTSQMNIRDEESVNPCPVRSR
jgi:hypothetical protein